MSEPLTSTLQNADTSSLAQQISVEVRAHYLPTQSKPERKQYAFGYTIRIFNHSNTTVQLLSRHWFITDEKERVREVKGDGVIGEQPFIEPGENYTYSSGAMLETPTGTMHGSYTLRVNDELHFDTNIPMFALLPPGKLH